MSKMLGIVIGSGGTGAKVAEAIVHATAAGMGPDRLLVGLVDQDGGNGNTSRARLAVEAYADARRLWRGEKSSHTLGNDTALLASEIASVSPEVPIWTPHAGSTSLGTAIGQRDPADEALFDALFQQGPTEQEMKFLVGYQARPNVGALAMALAMQDRAQAFVNDVNAAIASAQRDWEIRLIIAGSIFGGTGAAGLPTLARLLKNAVPTTHKAKFRMCGLLMLPYFSFDPPGEDSEPIYADVNRFIAGSRAALSYYHGLQNRDQLPYDQAYAIGWSPLFVAPGTPANGGAAQKNPAMLPELVAALAACRFCADANPGSGITEIVPRKDRDTFDWGDLPSPDADVLTPFRRLGHLLRFGVAWEHWDDLVVSNSAKGWFGKREAFFGKQGLNKIEWKKAPPESERAAMTNWTGTFLHWARMLRTTSKSKGIDFKLWQAPQDGRLNASSQAYADNFNALLVQPETPAPVSRADQVNTLLCNQRGPDSATGLGRMAAQLFHATATQ